MGPTDSPWLLFIRPKLPLQQSVVVDQVDVNDLAVLETEHDAPVAGYTHAPLSCPISLQRMQPETGCGGTTRMRCLLQPKQDTPKPRRQTRRQPRRIVPIVQRPQSFVPDLHVPTVTRHATRRNAELDTYVPSGLGYYGKGTSAEFCTVIEAVRMKPSWETDRQHVRSLRQRKEGSISRGIHDAAKRDGIADGEARAWRRGTVLGV